MSVLPFNGFRGGFAQNYPYWQALWVTAELSDDQVTYTLRIEGEPLWRQRELLGELEAAFTGWSQGKHLPSTTCGSSGNADIGPAFQCNLGS